MKLFKKEGHLKIRSSSDQEQMKKWIENGWLECDKNGFLVSEAKSKAKEAKKEAKKEDSKK